MEVVWAAVTKESIGFSRLVLTVVTSVGRVVSVACLAYAGKFISCKIYSP
ncbi:DMT family transporter [Entomobacter blattae]